MSNNNDFISSDVHKDELRWIAQRRKHVPENRQGSEPGGDTVGLALSGGGIRSATFNLGLLQALQRFGALSFTDYLSTVSGGGYIGSSLTWFMSTLKKFPFGTDRIDYRDLGSKVLYWLRSHGKYLIPGSGLTVWTLISAVFTGTLVNLILLVPIFLFGFKLFSINSCQWLLRLLHHFGLDGFFSLDCSFFSCIFAMGVLSAASFVVIILYIALTSRYNIFRKYRIQIWLRKFSGQVLMVAVILLIIGSIPMVYLALEKAFSGWIKSAISSISVTGILSLVKGFKGRTKENETKKGRSILLTAGLSLAVYGIFLWFFHIVSPLYGLNLHWKIIAAGLTASAVLALFTEVNHVSLHRFYRNRLMEAYMPEDIVVQDPGCHNPDILADRFLLTDVSPESGTPYHLVNTNIQTVGSKNQKLRSRGGDNFIFSPLYCGSPSTRYIKTGEYIKGKMNLATAMAISGAAVDPNTYATRSRPVAFLMSFFNIRLGYWIKNPLKQSSFTVIRPFMPFYMFCEMFGRGLSESCRSIHLSDGGHFENLGLYELVRRRCRYIIVSDAGADYEFNFQDLGKAIEMVRVDFGAKVVLDTDDFHLDRKTGLVGQPFITGAITYADDPGYRSELLYIKTSLFENIPEDIKSYKGGHEKFPDESTVDQFFDEEQFEAYRELGYRVGAEIFKGKVYRNPEELFNTIASTGSQD